MDGSYVPQQPLFASASGEDPDAFSQFIDVEDFFQGDFYDHDIDYTQLLGVLNSQSGEDGGDDAAPPISLSVGSFGDLTKATDYSLAGNGNSAPLMNQRVFESSGDPLKDVIMIPPMVPLPATSSSSSGRGGSTLFSNRRGGRAEPDADGDDEDDDDDDDDDEDEYEGEGGKGRKTRRPQKKSKLDSQEAALGSGTEKNRVERRERNREHAKRSRLRKKVLLDLLQDQLTGLRRENVALRRTVAERIPQQAASILSECTVVESELLIDASASNAPAPAGAGAGAVASASSSSHAPAAAAAAAAGAGVGATMTTRVMRAVSNQDEPVVLLEPDFRLMQALVTSQQTFVLSDPSLPDNPIVFCSDGFCKLSGYKRADVLGRNCRFMQGPGTDQRAVEKIREGVAEGRDMSVCLLNYKADGTSFWNQFFVAAIRDSKGNIVNFVGVQCEVNAPPIEQIKQRVKRIPVT